MKAIVLTLVLLLVCVYAKNVTEVTSENWNEVVKGYNYSLVSFTAPWCSFCKSLHPEYQKVAEDNKNDDVLVANFDCTKEGNADIASRLNVRGFPTIILLKKGEYLAKFNGDRSSEALSSWLLKKTSTPVTTLKSAQDLKQYLFDAGEKLTNVVVGYFNDEDSEERRQYFKLSEHPEAEEFEFVEMLGAEHKTAETKDHIALHRYFKPDPITHTSFGDILSLIRSEGYPLLPEIQESYQRLTQSDKLTGIIFVDPSKDNKDTLQEVENAAEQLKGKVSFVHGDGIMFAEYAENLGVKIQKLPCFVATYFAENKKYIPADTFVINSQQVKTFCEEILSGHIQPTLRSQPVPAQNPNSTVVELVGSTFDSAVMKDTQNDILVYFYAKWCKHCKAFSPRYDYLASLLKNVDNLIVAKIDGSQNDIPFDIEGYPLFALFTTNKAEPTVYEGKRSIKAMIQFIQDTAVASKSSAQLVTLDDVEEEVVEEQNQQEPPEGFNEKEQDEEEEDIFDGLEEEAKDIKDEL
ncbi:disulfide-isomerase [Acrasis kona]|uniref:Disulfide-isomerase n=1 Tax=Acrasis kona TaxID=1008807 RepID=A0AAW2YTG8_9EUKA